LDVRDEPDTSAEDDIDLHSKRTDGKPELLAWYEAVMAEEAEAERQEHRVPVTTPPGHDDDDDDDDDDD
jgi:hypothetical protein